MPKQTDGGLRYAACVLMAMLLRIGMASLLFVGLFILMNGEPVDLPFWDRFRIFLACSAGSLVFYGLSQIFQITAKDFRL